ncbi:MAG TPA: hypothetical protein VK589_21495 [Chryseolinea sp.]|nr:hypothetical protein [Chryseolinea sp.]
MSQSFTSKKYFSQINLIYFSQAGIMLVFAAVVFALVYSGQFAPTADQSLADNLSYLLTAVVIAGYAGAHFLYRYMLSRIDKNKDLNKKCPVICLPCWHDRHAWNFPGCSQPLFFS